MLAASDPTRTYQMFMFYLIFDTFQPYCIVLQNPQKIIQYYLLCVNVFAGVS